MKWWDVYGVIVGLYLLYAIYILWDSNKKIKP